MDKNIWLHNDNVRIDFIQYRHNSLCSLKITDLTNILIKYAQLIMSKKQSLILIIAIFILSGIIIATGFLLIDKQLALSTICVVVGYISIAIGTILCIIGNILLFFNFNW